MLLACSQVLPLPRRNHPFSVSASSKAGQNGETSANSSAQSLKRAKETVKKLLQNVDISASPYDTAWVAMVPSPHSPDVPLYPNCLNWLLDNQLPDGSWGLPHHHSSLLKDVLSSTLASLLVLKKWGIGAQLVEKGARFIHSNFSSATDEDLYSPVGFEIIFPGMLDYARKLDLNLQLERGVLNTLLLNRNQELERCRASKSQEVEAYLAYVSEGIGELQNWDMVMKYQRTNGSLFDSPSTSAAALIHVQSPGCLNYLNYVVKEFGDGVPVAAPLYIHARLCLVDCIERLGISRHFADEIEGVLNDTYRCWMQGDEDIFSDTSTCAIAFRLLRKHGYDVSSDPLKNRFVDGDQFSGLFGEHRKGIYDILELYQASEMVIHQDESSILEQRTRCKNLLEKVVADGCKSKSLPHPISHEVNDAIRFPYHSTLQRIVNRISIEHYGAENTRILKTSYCSSNFRNNDLLELAVEDYNQCQQIHREELKQLERWVTENRLDQLNFARQKSAYCYFSSAATMFAPELSDARMSWAKNGVLTTVVDDFFDVGGSLSELKNLIELFEKWDANISTDCISEQVEIVFSVLRSTILEIGHKASILQARDVTSHITKIWLDLLKSMLKEAEWTAEKSVPTMDRYMANAYVSFALGPIILPALYLVGPKLPEEVVEHSEYNSLFKLVSTGGRLLNDIHTFKRESEHGKLNAVSLFMIHGMYDVKTEAEAIRELNGIIRSHWRELQRLSIQKEGSVLPRACKDLFWNMSRVLQLFYMEGDGFSSNYMEQLAKSILYEPVKPCPR